MRQTILFKTFLKELLNYFVFNSKYSVTEWILLFTCSVLWSKYKVHLLVVVGAIMLFLVTQISRNRSDKLILQSLQLTDLSSNMLKNNTMLNTNCAFKNHLNEEQIYQHLCLAFVPTSDNVSFSCFEMCMKMNFMSCNCLGKKSKQGKKQEI